MRKKSLHYKLKKSPISCLHCTVRKMSQCTQILDQQCTLNCLIMLMPPVSMDFLAQPLSDTFYFSQCSSCHCRLMRFKLSPSSKFDLKIFLYFNSKTFIQTRKQISHILCCVSFKSNFPVEGKSFGFVWDIFIDPVSMKFCNSIMKCFRKSGHSNIYNNN